MTITTLAEQYNLFQHAFGQGDAQDYGKIVDNLFTGEFQKIANGDVLVGNRSQLLSQLNGVKDMAGKWSVQSHEIIPSQDNKKWTIRYLLTTEKAGKFEVIAILKTSGNQIEQINEVYYQPSQA